MKKERTNRTKLWRALGAFIAIDLILAGGVIGVLHWQDLQSQKKHSAMEQWIGVSADKTDGENAECYARAIGKALSLISIRNECQVKQGVIPISIANSSENECAASGEIVRMDNGQVIARVGLVRPGFYMKEAELTQELTAGSYPCVVRLSFYWAENDAYLGSGVKQALITVEE